MDITKLKIYKTKDILNGKWHMIELRLLLDGFHQSSHLNFTE